MSRVQRRLVAVFSSALRPMLVAEFALEISDLALCFCWKKALVGKTADMPPAAAAVARSFLRRKARGS